jgi:peptidyl-prolyl cis-trans isomerase C
VGDVSISRQDYWKARANDLYEQALQYQNFAQFVGPDQQGQYQALAEQSLSQIPTTWGGTDVDRPTLEKMIEDQIYLQGLPELGLDVTPEEIHTYALNRFAPPTAPLLTPVPTPTLTAARAAMATSTAAAFLAPPEGSPALATPLASPVAGTPAVGTPMGGTPAATPMSDSAAATPVTTVPTFPPATPNPEEARATAEAGLAQFKTQFLDLAHLSPADYERLVAAPALAREEVRNALAATVGQSAPQVHAAHILVPTREEAEAARVRVVDGGEPFATVAREVSTDTGTAENGGDLGWFTREEMVAPFAEAAFALEPGAISEPVESEFGWHVINTIAKDPDRVLTDSQISRLQQAAVTRWVDAERAALSISSTLPPSPTPLPPRFAPPVGAPSPPTPTLPPVASPLASPVPVTIAGTPAG